jgi:phosphoribosylglycinamide formyltransferase-1
MASSMEAQEAVPICVFASGRGSNFDALWAAVQAGLLNVKVLAVVSDRPDAPVLSKARAVGVTALAIPLPPTSGQSADRRRRQHEEKILDEFKRLRLNPKYLVLAGYMRILTPHLIDAFRCDRGYVRMVNVHPSLLPSFPGVHAYGQAFRYGAKVTGVTVHLVEKEVDSGPICAQESFSIADCKTELEVEQRGLAVEHRLFPRTLNWVLSENFQVVPNSEGRICVRQN